jgi:hypothetical protein
MRGPGTTSSDDARIVRVPAVGARPQAHGTNDRTRPMGAHNAATSDQTTLSRWRRGFRLRFALFVAGIVMVAAYFALGGWAISIGSYPTSLGAGFAIYLIGTAGGPLILLAGTAAYYHWRGLRLIEGNA